MRRLNRFAGITALLFFSLSLATLSFFSLLAQAQEPPPFEIRVIPQAEYALSGQPFTYTVIITNVSLHPLEDVLVKVKIPAGTLFVESYFINPKWLVGGVQRGQTGEIVWLSREPIAPNETMTFDLVISVLPEFAGPHLINDEYSVLAINNGQILASGPPIKTQVLISTPTPSPTAKPAATPIPITASSPTLLSQADPGPATLTPTVWATFTPIPQVSSPVVSGTTISSATSNIFLIISIAALILFVVGLIWFWKYRSF